MTKEEEVAKQDPRARLKAKQEPEVSCCCGVCNTNNAISKTEQFCTGIA